MPRGSRGAGVSDSKGACVIAPALYCPRLVGRDAELNALLRLAGASAAGGAPAIVLVYGEAGIGKTRLLTEFRSWASRRATVAFATCMSFAPVPLAPAQALLDAFGEHMPVETATGDEGGAAAQLRVFRRLLQTLRAAAAVRPVVAIVDDLHWADTATVEFLNFLGAELADERLTFVAAYRSEDTERPPALDRVLARLSRSPRVHRIALRPLTGAGIAELVDAALGTREHPPADVLHHVRERSEGNPLFAEELLKSAVDDRADPAPASLRTLIADRTSRMSPEELHLLELAALIGRRFSLAFLERLADGKPSAAVLAFLRHAVKQHFLVEDRSAPGWFTFRHALVREAIVAPILLVEDQTAHLAIARAIEGEPDAGERVAELSEHYWRAGARAECLPYARSAAERALAQFAYREAAEQFERALACASGCDAATVALHEGAAIAHQTLGNADEAQRNYAAAADLAERFGDDERAIEALLELSLSMRRRGSAGEAAAASNRAETLERRSPNERLRVRILAQRAQLHVLAGDFEAGKRTLAEAEPLLETARPRDAFRFYHARAGVRSFCQRDYEGAIDDAERALGFARESRDHNLIVSGSTSLALHAGRIRPTGVAIEALEEAMALVERHGELYQTGVTRNAYANYLLVAGRLDEARRQLNALLAEAHWPLTTTVNMAATAGWVAICLRDEVLAARADAVGTLERVRKNAPMLLWAGLAATVADLHANEGRFGDARATLEPLIADFFEEEIMCVYSLPVAAHGDQRQVEAVAPIIARYRNSANPIVRTHCALFEAYAAARFDSMTAAHRRAAEAAVGFEKMEAPLLEAEARVLRGEKQRALALMSACGARRLLRQITKRTTEQELTKPLSRREREIAELAAAGNSTRAIAERLVIGVRTVETHLAAAYAKLGVTSRAALAAVLDVGP